MRWSNRPRGYPEADRELEDEQVEKTDAGLLTAPLTADRERPPPDQGVVGGARRTVLLGTGGRVQRPFAHRKHGGRG